MERHLSQLRMVWARGRSAARRHGCCRSGWHSHKRRQAPHAVPYSLRCSLRSTVHLEEGAAASLSAHVDGCRVAHSPVHHRLDLQHGDRTARHKGACYASVLRCGPKKAVADAHAALPAAPASMVSRSGCFARLRRMTAKHRRKEVQKRTQAWHAAYEAYGSAGSSVEDYSAQLQHATCMM